MCHPSAGFLLLNSIHSLDSSSKNFLPREASNTLALREVLNTLIPSFVLAKNFPVAVSGVYAVAEKNKVTAIGGGCQAP